MINTKAREIHIIGAGFSGLSLAYYLVNKGQKVRLFEKNRVGGLLGTQLTEHGPAEQAANAILAGSEFENLCSHLDLHPLLASGAHKKRYFHRPTFKAEKSLTRWPLNLMETLQLIFKGILFLIKFLFNRSALYPERQLSLLKWCEQHLTKAFAENFIQPALQGIYAHKISNISASLLLSRLFIAKQKKEKKQLLGFEHGMGDLVNGLRDYLTKQGVEIEGHEVSQLPLNEEASAVILCSNARDAAQLLSKYHDVSQQLQQIPYSPLVTATVFYNSPASSPVGFGCLFHQQSATQALGVLWNHYIFPQRKTKPSETWILGGDKFPEIISWSDTEILDHIKQTNRQLIQHEMPIISYKITRWNQGLPCYSPGAELSILNLAKQPLKDQHIFLHGNYLGGIGLSQILQQSKTLSEQIVEGLS